MFAFIKNLLGVKADQAIKTGVEALVRWDPKAATEAELRTMEQNLDQLGREVAQARLALDKEQKEADAIVALYNQRLAAAEHLGAQAAAETDPAKKAQVEKSLTTLLDMLEQMAPEIEREKQDALDAQEFLSMLENTYADAGSKLRNARAELERAQRDLSRAEQQRAVADRQAEAARKAAGLASSTDGLGTALKAMKESAEKERVSAEAQLAKTKLLSLGKPEQEDPNIAAALAAASGQAAVPKADVGARLAALRGGQKSLPSG